MKRLALLLPLLLLVLGVRAQQALTKQQEKGLVAFARVFGYVRYFHPSDEAQQISWPMLATKGSRQMLAVRDDNELIKTLNDLFQPLGPTIRVFPTGQPLAFDPAALRPPAAARASRVISWQNQGIYTGEGKPYRGVRLGRPAAGAAMTSYSFLKDVDVSCYKGLPYEVDLTWTQRQPTDGQGLTFTIAHRQKLGKVERLVQRQPSQTLTAAGHHYRLGGKIDTAARQLEAAFVVPDDFAGNLNAKVYVLVNGQRVELTAKAKEVSEPTQKQTVELVFSSPNLLAAPLFQEQSRLGDYVSREVADGISCTVPLALAADAAHTYPRGDSLRLSALRVKPADRVAYPAEWARYQGERTLGLPEVRLANVVETWNALRHGYAYWGSASAPPDTLLLQTLRRTYADNTTAGFVRTMQLLLAALNDGHAWVSTTFEGSRTFTVPLAFERVAGQVVVTQVAHPAETLQVRRGDVLETIDGVPAEQVLVERAKLISGSPQVKEYYAFKLLASSSGRQPAALGLRRGDSLRTSSVPRTVRSAAPAPPAPANGWLTPDVYYYNLATTSPTFSATEIQTLAKAKAVIFDVRCYPPNDGLFTLIPMLLKKSGDVTLFYDLNMLRPDQEALRLGPNVGHYAPGPQHLPGHMYFLTDAVTQSAPETFLALVRGLHLGTLVGRPTSGADGGRSQLALQGGLSIGYSGARMLNADGSRHHAIGIQPDVLVKPTLESIRQGQDLILETALRLAQASQ